MPTSLCQKYIVGVTVTFENSRKSLKYSLEKNQNKVFYAVLFQKVAISTDWTILIFWNDI